jgi:guanylate kinase
MAQSQAKPLMFLISAPSGAGKTTLCTNLLEASSNLRRVITCTTRPPRAGEQDGVDYHFLDPATFLRRVQSGHCLEHASVYGNSYGTLKSEVAEKLDQGFELLINVDVQGAASIRKAAGTDPALGRALVTIFLTPPSMEILEQRLRTRAADPDDVIRRRLTMARQEAAQWRHFDYLLLSGTPEEDTRRALAIMEAERMRCQRAAPLQL